VLEEPGPWGTGPFILKSGVSTLEKRSPEVVLEPNPNYWNPARRPKVRIVFDNIMGRDEAIDLVSNTEGRVDLVTEITPAEAAKVAKSKYARVVRNDAKTVLVGVFNQSGPNSRWTDMRLRKALNHAIDRNALVATAAGGYGTVMPAMIFPGGFGSGPGVKPYAFDPGKAEAMMKEGGLKEGSSVTIVAGEAYKPVVDAIAKNLAAVGLKVNPVWTGAPKGDDWDIWLVEHFDWSPEFPGGVVYREFFGKDGGFRKMSEDPAFEQMYAKLVSTSDKAGQEQLIQQMDKYVHDQANVLFLYAPAKLYAVSKRVNFVPYKTTMLELAETSIVQ
jgi:peptide/nickel transport system substrate-binding protein